MNTKTKLLIATLAASVALSFSASAATTPSTTLTPQVQTTEKARMLVQLLAQSDPARFTAPKFCYVGRMKVACTITDAPSQDPTGTRP